MFKLLIIQPWFCGFGHPAQSLINFASAIGRDERVQYLVSLNPKVAHGFESMRDLEKWGVVRSFRTRDISGTGKWNTLLALFVICRMRIQGIRYERIFFFDGHLKSLAIFWPFFHWIIRCKKVNLIYLHGPEQAMNTWFSRLSIKYFLMRSEATLFLRTEELASAWKDALNGNLQDRIRYFPSLEIPDAEAWKPSIQPSSELKFGIIGQVRPGKGIDWLVPAFQNRPCIGKLTVAGAFYDEECRAHLPVLEHFDGFVNRFLPEIELLQLASTQDYLLMLYDKNWDPRLESAVLYLAARVNRPVVVYNKGWSGRKVREFGCGILASENTEHVIELLINAPRPGSQKYSILLKGVERFRRAHSVTALREKVLSELLE